MADVTSVLDLSDEDIMNLDPATLATAAAPASASATEAGQDDQNQDDTAAADAQAAAAAAAEQQDDTTQSKTTEGNGDENDDEASAQGSADSAKAGKDDDAEADASKTAADASAKTAAEAAAGDASKAAKDAPANGKPAAPAAPAAVDGDLKAFHDKITAPFQAGGRQMQVKDADEAVQLMQMGVGFNKKMAQLKPNLAMIKSLENAGLLSQDKIDFLIDVAAGKPEAISKLVQDSGVDPLDLSAEKAGGYKPTSHKVSDREQALDEVWSELEGSAGFDRTVNVVAKEWDKASQAVIGDQPALLRVINGHMQNGVYDLVAAEVDRERILGRLTGLSDLEAYRQVGDAMEAAGKFKHLGSAAGQPAAQSQGAPAVPAVVQPKPKQADDSNRNDRKRAASPARTTAAAAQKVVGSPLAMSDEDILKL